MHLLKGELEVLALDAFLWISFKSYVCHITHLIVGNLNFFKKIYFTTFSIDINVPPSRTQKVGFSALVQQEMGTVVAAGEAAREQGTGLGMYLFTTWWSEGRPAERG